VNHFWVGFKKQADESKDPVSQWLSDADEKNKELSVKPEDKRRDPREAGEWIGPEVWYHNWPSSGHV